MCPCVCTALKMCMLLSCFFPIFCHFFYFEAFPEWKWKKTEATCQVGIDVAQFFHFMHFFPLHSGSPQKWPKKAQNWSKYCLLAKICNLGKSHKIKKNFRQTLQGLLDQQRHSGLGWSPTVVVQSPTTDLLNSAEFGCIEENKSCSLGYPKFIYSIVGMHMLVCVCMATISSHASAGAMTFRRIAANNSSFYKLLNFNVLNQNFWDSALIPSIARGRMMV